MKKAKIVLLALFAVMLLGSCTTTTVRKRPASRLKSCRRIGRFWLRPTIPESFKRFFPMFRIEANGSVSSSSPRMMRIR